jgi:hypothetical protein
MSASKQAAAPLITHANPSTIAHGLENNINKLELAIAQLLDVESVESTSTAARGLSSFGSPIKDELHRMVPTLAAMRGFCSTEIEVRHHARRFGHSKYGFERFLRRFRERPSHFMNATASLYIVVGAVLAITGTIAGVATLKGLSLLLTALLLGGMSAATFLVGLVSELCIHGPLTPVKDLPVVDDTRR